MQRKGLVQIDTLFFRGVAQSVLVRFPGHDCLASLAVLEPAGGQILMLAVSRCWLRRMMGDQGMNCIGRSVRVQSFRAQVRDWNICRLPRGLGLDLRASSGQMKECRQQVVHQRRLSSDSVCVLALPAWLWRRAWR